jgi:hypothetical protein
MNPFQSLQKRVKTLIKATENPAKLADVILSDMETELADLQVNQMLSGEGTQGTLKRKRANYYPYTDGYAEYKRSLGLPVQVVNTELTGDFHDGVFARSSVGFVEFNSTDYKANGLAEAYPGLFGLSGQYLQEAQEDAQMRLVEYLHGL